MIFVKKQNFGLVESIFLNQHKKSYLNLCRVNTKHGLTVGNATSIANNKKLCIKKSYSEYLERFAMGIPMGKSSLVKTVNIMNNEINYQKNNSFGYGDTEFGHSDTTGTASGIYSERVISKALCELIEKNEVLAFWYSDCGKKINVTKEIEERINQYNFVSEKIYLYKMDEISNYPTIIAIGIKKNEVIGTGVACTENFNTSLRNALEELRIIEWQQYKNPCSVFKNFSQSEIISVINKKNKILEFYNDEKKKEQKELKLADWIEDIEIKVIYSENRWGLKTVKCISKDLIVALPLKVNIQKSQNKMVIRKYFNHKKVDCPIV